MIILSTFNFDRNGRVKFYTSFHGIIWTINVTRFPTHELTLGRTHKFILLLWLGRGGERGVDGTPLQSNRYVAVFRNDFAFSEKPLIFLTRWGIFYGWWHCWRPVMSYLVTIETDHHWTCLKLRERDKRTRQVLMIYPIGKISEKP